MKYRYKNSTFATMHLKRLFELNETTNFYNVLLSPPLIKCEETPFITFHLYINTDEFNSVFLY